MAAKTPNYDPRNSRGTYGQRVRRALWPILGTEAWVGGERKFWYRKPLEPRETRARDRSLRGKARIRARKEANKTSH